MPPRLTSFPQFPKLPTEIRFMIWNLSLEARTVEIQWTENRGFFTRVLTPVALRVCHDSRDAVKSQYPHCFGNVIYKPVTAFNFSLDTLYVDHDLQHQALHFLGSLSAKEVAKVKYLAVDDILNEDFELGGDMEWDLLTAYRKLAANMPALEEYHLVSNVAYCVEDGVNDGDGPMELYEDWPEGVRRQHYCGPEMWIGDEEPSFSCDHDELPAHTKELAGLKVPKMGAIWGWRPLKK
ncbi:uncharacterized protein RAG0_10431 [Rhynchosporium agropyri]|uniref:2EXR domain-containing protein n=1 Tax=Rhynchosporium agropyri TaxID=914238 RepID=A0A1E1KZW0_9HELO|nr:uncharacterized protein RAG0_10431 [Rhynchosporium agropyri]